MAVDWVNTRGNAWREKLMEFAFISGKIGSEYENPGDRNEFDRLFNEICQRLVYPNSQNSIPFSSYEKSTYRNRPSGLYPNKYIRRY